MDLMSLLVHIGADTKDAEQGIKKTQSLGKKLGGGLKKVGKVSAAAIGVATAAVVAFTKSAIDAGEKFDTSMSNVAAISGATGDELTSLRDKAKEMGAKTKFSASQAADAFSYMAMAGWDTKDMLDGIEGVMNLAAASGEDLATTSDIVTDALTAFGLKAEDSGHFADVLAAASSNANTNVAMMGETFKYVAPVAGSLGLEADDCAVAIGLMANSGIKASQAGTSLRSILTRMVKPTKQSQAAMDKLGISITNSDGSMKSMDEIMAMLRESFSGLTEAEQGQYAALLAGQNGMSGLLAIVNASEEDYNKLTDAVANASQQYAKLTDGSVVPLNDALASGAEIVETYNGEAERMAAVMQDNLAGDMEIFKSAVEGAQIAISDQLSPSLREFVQFGTSAVADLTKAFEEDGLNGAMAALGTILSQAITMITEKLPMFVEAGLQLLMALVQGIIDNLPQLAAAALKIAETVVNSIQKWLDDNYPKVGESFHKIRDAVSDAYTAIAGFWTNNLKPKLDAMWRWITKSLIPAIQKGWQDLQPKIEVVFNAIKGFWTDTLKPVLKQMWQWITTQLIPAVRKAWQGLQPIVVGVFEGIKTAWEEVLKPILDAMQKFIVEDLIPIINGAWETISPIVEEVFNGIVNLWNDHLQPVLQTLWDFIVSDVVPAVTEAIGGLRDTWEGVFTAISDFWENTGRPIFESVQEAVGIWYDALNGFFQGIIDFIRDVFAGDWESAWEDIKGAFGSIFGALGDLLKDPINGIIEGLNWMIGKVEGAINSVIRTINNKVRIKLDPIVVFGKTIFQGLDWGPNLKEADFGRIEYLYKGGVLGEGENAIVGEYAPEKLTVRNGQAVVTPIKDAERFGGGDTITVNVYQRDGEDIEALARRIEQIFTRQSNQRRAAYA